MFLATLYKRDEPIYVKLPQQIGHSSRNNLGVGDGDGWGVLCMADLARRRFAVSGCLLF